MRTAIRRFYLHLDLLFFFFFLFILLFSGALFSPKLSRNEEILPNDTQEREGRERERQMDVHKSMQDETDVY